MRFGEAPESRRTEPGAAVALTTTVSPAFYHPVAGTREPPAGGLGAVVRKYWVVKLPV